MSTGFVEADSVDHACRLLADDPGTARIIGGGTGLMLMARMGLLSVGTLVSLRQVDDPELRSIELRDSTLRIGGLCTLTQVLEHPVVRHELPALVSLLHRLSSVRTRNVATIAGCIAHGDPHMDLPPLLIALDAAVMVAGPSGRRQIPCGDFFVRYYEVALNPGDVVTSIEIPVPAPGTFVAYRKFTGALAEDWPVVGVALRLRGDGGYAADVAVAVGAVEAAARRLPEVERALAGTRAGELDAEAIGELAAGSVEPSDDQLGTTWYKRKIVAAETARGIRAWTRVADNGQ